MSARCTTNRYFAASILLTGWTDKAKGATARSPAVRYSVAARPEVARTHAALTILAAADGGVLAFPSSLFHGSAATVHLNAPVVGIAETNSGNGYRLVGADGGVFTYGDAPYLGSMAGTELNAPIVGIQDVGEAGAS